MKSVSIPNSVTTIEEGVFEHCGLLSVDIPNSVTSIGSQAFRGCDSLRTVNIPNSVTSIGASAFCDCKNLKTITIPNSVTSIGLFAFLHAAIETLYYDCTEDPQVINTTLKNLYIGDNLTNVCDYFKRNQLQKIVLGKKVSQIEEGAFESSEIEEFTITGEEPPYCSANIFGTQDLSNATLFVPEGKAEYYKTTAPWSGFEKIKELEGTIVDTDKNRGVSLHLSNGTITLSGLNTNEIVIFYSTDGKELGAVKAIDGTAQFAAQSGSVVVAKIGVECVKIAVK